MQRGARIPGKRRALRGRELDRGARCRLGVRSGLHGLAPDPLADAAEKDREDHDEQAGAGDGERELDAAGREPRVPRRKQPRDERSERREQIVAAGAGLFRGRKLA